MCYLAEILDEEDTLIHAKYLKADNNILQFKVRSRHKKSKYYKVHIDYIPNFDNIDGIHRYCCDCPNGDRTLGSCCHVAAIV